jgi:FkbM family methyltransferase
MRINWLVDDVTKATREVRELLDTADALIERGHEVTLLALSGPPRARVLRARFAQLAQFGAELPPADIHLATSAAALAAARQAPGVTVRYGAHTLQREAESPPATATSPEPLRTEPLPRESLPSAVDRNQFYPGPERGNSPLLRIGVVESGADPATRAALVDALALAHRAGQAVHVVCLTDPWPALDPRLVAFPVERHDRADEPRLAQQLRSLDVLVAIGDAGARPWILDAMACGVPCVLAEDLDLPRNAAAPGALFVPPASALAWAEAIVVAGRVADVRAQLRVDALRWVAGCTAAARAERMAQVLEGWRGASRTATWRDALAGAVQVADAAALDRVFVDMVRTMRPQIVTDIGSRDAEMAIACKQAHPAATVIAFEPNPENFFEFAAPAVQAGVLFVPVALGAQSGIVELKLPAYASVRADATRLARGIGSVRERRGEEARFVYQAAMLTLADFFQLPQHRAATYAHWIDVEGCSADVLAGMSDAHAAATLFLKVEVETREVWQGQQLVGDVIGACASRGFTPACWFEHELQFDIIFANAKL